jgi:hypothetical protein
MQNKYFGDIHDFYKYFFLKEVTKDYSLGIHWCLTPDELNKNDGNKALSLKEEKKDATLYRILTTCENRNIKFIEPYFPKSTKYYDVLHTEHLMNSVYDNDAVSKLQSQDIVFFDPDNGIEVASTNNTNKYKYVSYSLLHTFWDLGKSLIIYQHGCRVKGQLDEKIKTLYNLTGKTANVITVKKGSVTFICMIQGEKHCKMKHELGEFRKNKEYKVENWRGAGDIS